jgi:DNA-directed RNA polymerase subunit M/transcription elongation factor TFIIS
MIANIPIIPIINDNKNTEYISPFNQSKYNFVIENSIDLKDSWIQFAESNIDRPSKQIQLSNLLSNIDTAIKIESSIFEYALIYCLNNKYDKNYIRPTYDEKFNFILTNLDESNKKINNKNFKSNILSGKINPSYVAFLSPQQVHPEKWAYLIKKRKYIEERENNIAYSDAYKCYKCGESKCKITQAQTRSADEPMTTFVVCLVCHNTFKFC